MIVFYSILNKIVYQPINKDITSNHRYIFIFSNKFYILFLCKRFQIFQYLVNEIIKDNFFIPSYSLKLTHVKKCFYHLAKPVILFRQHLYHLYGVCITARMLSGMIQVKLYLH